MPAWLPAAAVVALLLAGALAFGAGFRIVPPDVRQSPDPTMPALDGRCRLELPVRGRDAILFGVGFSPSTDVVLVIDRADGSRLELDHESVDSLRTDRGGGFFIALRPFPQDLGRGRVTATAGCTASTEIEVTAEDLPTPCPDATTPSEPLVDGPRYRAAVASDEPLAWWGFDDAGPVALDSADDHTGIYVGDVEHAVGTPLSDGGSAYFHHQFPDPTFVEVQPIVLGGDFSIEFWLYFCHWADGDAIAGSGEARAALLLGDGELHLDGEARDVIWESEPVVSGAWQHYVVTRAGGAMQIYRNGSLVSSDQDADWTDPFTISRIGSGIDDNLLGYLDEVALYDHSLDPERIAAHAQP